MKEIKLYEHQNKLIDCQDKTIICNWGRGLFSTSTVLFKILKYQIPNVLYYSLTSLQFRCLTERLKDIQNLFPYFYNNTVKNVILDNNNFIIIEYYSGIKTHIFSPKSVSKDSDLIYDLIVYDGAISFNSEYKAKQYISMVSINNYYKQLENLYRDNKITLIEYDYNDALNDGSIDKDFYDKIKKEAGSSIFYQEFCLKSNPNSDKDLI